MLFYQIGELFQSYAVGKSRRNITALMDIRPDYANIEADGQLTKVDPYDVAIGDIIVVQPGEKVPLDGIVVEGKASLDTSALTGESVPRNANLRILFPNSLGYIRHLSVIVPWLWLYCHLWPTCLCGRLRVIGIFGYIEP